MINPNIALQAKAPNLQSSFRLFNDSLNSVQNRQMNAQSMQQGQQLFDAQMSANKRMLSKERENELIRSVAEYAPILEQQITNGDYLGAVKGLQKRKETLESRGIDTTETDEAIQTILNGNPEDILPDLQIAKTEAMNRGLVSLPDQDKKSSVQFGAQQTFKDSKGNLFFGTTRRDPNTGAIESALASVDGSSSQPVGQVELVTGLGQTREEKVEDTNRQFLLKQAAEKGKAAYDQFSTVTSSMRTIDSAIKELDNGAVTGKIENLFPSFSDSTIALENIANRMGLDVVSATTFGGLSEGELKLAMETALPRGLKSKDLRKWLVDKKAAQKKLAGELRKMAVKLGSGEVTISEYLEKNATMTESSGANQSQSLDINNLSDQDIDNLSLEELQRLSEQL